jgi:predicted RNase H-like nuclease
MSTLLIGFDSAWTAHNSGAITAALHCGNGKYADLGPPQVADFPEAKALITHWQTVLLPTSTVVLLDQPCIVANATGQRPVENIAGSLVGLRRGAMPPANTSKASMFGETAPVWDFLNQFGGRPHEFNQLKTLLLGRGRNEPVAITTALSGAGGFGKTTLAAALCHDPEFIENSTMVSCG